MTVEVVYHPILIVDYYDWHTMLICQVWSDERIMWQFKWSSN